MFTHGSAKKISPSPTVSVLVPHYNDIAGLRACLESLCAQTYPQSDVEIIVADNNTPGGVADIAMEFPDVRFITVEEQGAAPARNAAMAIASGQVFAFIDADCVAASDWIETGLKGLKVADYSGGRIDVTFESRQGPSPVEAFEIVFGFRQRLYLKRKHFSATANLFVSRETALAIGPFRNEVAEDLDWGRRAHALGFRLAFNAKSIVNHPARRDWDGLVRKWDRLTRERWNGFEERRLFQRVEWACLAAATALSAAPHLWTVLTSRKLSRFGDRVAAAGVLARIRFWRARRMLSLLTTQASRSS